MANSPKSVSPPMSDSQQTSPVIRTVTGNAGDKWRQQNHSQGHYAFFHAVEQLRATVQPYMPLRREPGTFTFNGIDLVDHANDQKPLNTVGVLVFANFLLSLWQEVVEPGLKKRIDSLDRSKVGVSKDQSGPSASQSMRASKPHLPLSQPLGCTLGGEEGQAKPKRFIIVGGGMIFMKENYLRRVELENLVYRRHLAELEKKVRAKVTSEMKKMLAQKSESPQSEKAQSQREPTLLAPKGSKGKAGSLKGHSTTAQGDTSNLSSGHSSRPVLIKPKPEPKTPGSDTSHQIAFCNVAHSAPLVPDSSFVDLTISEASQIRQNFSQVGYEQPMKQPWDTRGHQSGHTAASMPQSPVFGDRTPGQMTWGTNNQAEVYESTHLQQSRDTNMDNYSPYPNHSTDQHQHDCL